MARPGPQGSHEQRIGFGEAPQPAECLTCAEPSVLGLRLPFGDTPPMRESRLPVAALFGQPRAQPDRCGSGDDVRRRGLRQRVGLIEPAEPDQCVPHADDGAGILRILRAQRRPGRQSTGKIASPNRPARLEDQRPIVERAVVDQDGLMIFRHGRGSSERSIITIVWPHCRYRACAATLAFWHANLLGVRNWHQAEAPDRGSMGAEWEVTWSKPFAW